MKKKTKIIAVCLTMLMAVLTIGITMKVFAADKKVTLAANLSGDTAKNGEITVKLDMTDNANLGGMQAQLTYDKSKLQYVSGSLTDEFKASAETAATDVVDSDTGVGIAVVFNAASNYNGTIAEIKFKVLADGGETVEIGLNSELADMEYQEMTVETKAASFVVKVPMTSVAIEGEANRSLLKGETAQLTVKILPENTTETNKKVNWESSDKKVATVDENGLVTAVGGGKAVITATTQVGALTAQANITVNVNLTGITIKAPAGSIEEGKTMTLSVAAMPEDATEKVENVEWSSSDQSIAKVDNKGIVTAVKAGEVKITAKAAGFTQEIKVSVTEAKVEQQPTQQETQQPTQQETQQPTQQETTKADETSPAENNTTDVSGATDAAKDEPVNTGDPVNTALFMALILLCAGTFGMTALWKRSAIKK